MRFGDFGRDFERLIVERVMLVT